MTTTVKRLRITGLHGRQDVDFEFHDPISIFMGPNGVGKSTILNIFVHLLSRQWQRLGKQPFRSATVEFVSGDEVTVQHADCLDFNSSEVSSRTQTLVSALAEAGYLEGVLEGDSQVEQEAISPEKGLGIQARDLRMVRNALLQDDQTAKSLAALLASSKLIRRNFSAQLIYLPTYRRIEQEISEVLSMSTQRVRRMMATDYLDLGQHRPGNYTEIVKFGM